jgi:citrate lyase beta subunit
MKKGTLTVDVEDSVSPESRNSAFERVTLELKRISQGVIVRNDSLNT